MIPEPGLRTLADDDENDFVNVLTSRGIDYDAPAERRASIKAVAKSADKRCTRKVQSLQVWLHQIVKFKIDLYEPNFITQKHRFSN